MVFSSLHISISEFLENIWGHKPCPQRFWLICSRLEPGHWGIFKALQVIPVGDRDWKPFLYRYKSPFALSSRDPFFPIPPARASRPLTGLTVHLSLTSASLLHRAEWARVSTHHPRMEEQHFPARKGGFSQRKMSVGPLTCLLCGPEQVGPGPLGRITCSLFSKMIFLVDGLTKGIFWAIWFKLQSISAPVSTTNQ